MRILVERVEVEKINGDRKHVRLIIYFNFNADTIYRELEIDNKKKNLSYQIFIKNVPVLTQRFKIVSTRTLKLIVEVLKAKKKNALLCSDSNTKQSRFCCNG